jgi:hypothetical protein
MYHISKKLKWVIIIVAIAYLITVTIVQNSNVDYKLPQKISGAINSKIDKDTAIEITELINSKLENDQKSAIVLNLSSALVVLLGIIFAVLSSPDIVLIEERNRAYIEFSKKLCEENIKIKDISRSVLLVGSVKLTDELISLTENATPLTETHKIELLKIIRTEITGIEPTNLKCSSWRKAISATLKQT